MERQKKKSISNSSLFFTPKNEKFVAPQEKFCEKHRGGGAIGSREECVFYTQGSPIYQLLGDGELGWRTIEECFFAFF